MGTGNAPVSYYPDASGWTPSKLGVQSNEEKAMAARKYLQILANERLYWEPLIDNLIMYVNHGRRSIQDRDLWPGMPTGMEVYDDSAMLACNMLVDGMVGYLCSRNMPWFALTLPGQLNFPRSSQMRHWNGKRADSYPAVQKWLQDCQDEMYSAFNRSNFYDVNPEFIRDGAVCGTASMLVEEDLATARIVFTVPHFRECFIAANRFGKVDTVYRVYKMTLRQLAQQFGEKTMQEADSNFENDYKSNMHAEREILHAVYPRFDYDPSRIDAKGRKIESLWVYRKGGKILESSGSGVATTYSDSSNDTRVVRESGYDSMPIITWRWRVNSDEIYGRGPAHDAWVSIAKANQMGRTNLIAGQKAAEPPYVAPGYLKNKFYRGPNAVTFLDDVRGDIRMQMPQPLQTGVQTLPFALDMQKEVAQIIGQMFHSDVFMLLTQVMQEHGTGRPVTAQIAEMQTEKAAILGTRVGNLQSEAFDPLIARVYEIESRAGRIPMPPDILLRTEHRGVEIEYLGLLAQAQTRLTKVRSIQSGVALIQQITAFDPIAMHAIDTDQMVREAWDAVGAPVTCLRDPKAIAQIRQVAEKQRQQQQAVENAPKIAKAAHLMGKGTEPSSPLAMLTGNSPEPGEAR